MRAARLTLLGLAALFALPVVSAEAQDQSSYSYRDSTGLSVRVRPRSWLDAGQVVRAGTYGNPVTNGRLIAASNSLLPAYGVGFRDQFGFSTLPDPITNGPFVGARNPFGPVDYSMFDPPRY